MVQISENNVVNTLIDVLAVAEQGLHEVKDLFCFSHHPNSKEAGGHKKLGEDTARTDGPS